MYDGVPKPAHDGASDNQVADAIVRAAQPKIGRVFRDPRSIAWATVRMEPRLETLRIKSKRFASFLRSAHFASKKKTARDEALKQAAAHFETLAVVGGDIDEVRIRVAETEGTIFLDLGDDAGRMVEVKADAWRVIDEASVPFFRPNGLRPLPVPERGGGLEDILALLNLKRPAPGDAEGADSFVLLAAWLCAALRARGPYPLLVLRGPPGSAKTTAVEIIRSLIDPAAPLTRNLPDSERDLFIATGALHVMAVDNVSAISPAMSDALCRLSTGGGYATRSLFTDGDETIFEATRPVILNGIGAFLTRGDLQDRALTIELAPIDESARRLKSEIDAALEVARPKLLGALLDALVIGLSRAPSVRRQGFPRMADFAHWAMACETAFADEGDFFKAWQMSAANALPDDLAADPFASAVVDMLRASPPNNGLYMWEGGASELSAAINPDGRNRDLPKGARGVAAALDRSRPLLTRAGVKVRRLPRTKARRPFELMMAAETSPSSHSSPGPAFEALRDDDRLNGPPRPSPRLSPGEAHRTGRNDDGDGGDDLVGVLGRGMRRGEI
jgi:hypothetical protein